MTTILIWKWFETGPSLHAGGEHQSRQSSGGHCSGWGEGICEEGLYWGALLYRRQVKDHKLCDHGPRAHRRGVGMLHGSL